MSKTSLVLTVLGNDRPGLVDAIAATVAEHGGNWVESRMAHLAGQFAGILRVKSMPSRPNRSRRRWVRWPKVRWNRMSMPMHPAASHGKTGGPAFARRARPPRHHPRNQPRACHAWRECRRTQHRMQAGAQFRPIAVHAQAQLRLPEGVAADALRTALEDVAHDLMVDLSLE